MTATVKSPEAPPTLTLLHISDQHFGQARGNGRSKFVQVRVATELVKDPTYLVY